MAASGKFIYGPVAYASLPAAAGTGALFFQVSDIGPSGAGSVWISNATRYSPLGGRVVVASMGTPVSGIANSETIELQALFPINSIQINDTVRMWVTPTKSGTTDSLTGTVRIGTAGTTSDTSVMAGTHIATASLSAGLVFDFKLLSATSIQKTGQGATGSGSYSTASTSAAASPVTITSAAANALYVSYSIKSSSTNDTVGMLSGMIELITP